MNEFFRDLIEEAVNKAFAALLSEKQGCKCNNCSCCEKTEKPEDGKLLTVPEACKELGCSRCTLHRYARNGYITPVKIGGMVRYRKADINARKGA